MSVSTGISFTLSDALKEADKMDNHFNSWVKQSIEIQDNLRKAFDAKSGGDMRDFTSSLRTLQSLVKEIGGSTLSVNVDATKIEQMATALDAIIKDVDLLDGLSKSIFDTEGIYAASKSLVEVEDNLQNIREEIDAIKEKWRSKTDDALRGDFEPPINPKTGKAFGKDTQMYKTAQEALETEIERTRGQRQAEQAVLEFQLQAAIEREAIAKKELNYAKMTQDEKSKYIKGRLDEILKAEEQQANKIRSEYKKLWSDLNTYSRSRATIDKAAEGKTLTDEQQAEYDSLVRLEQQTEARIQQMYSQHQEILTDITVRETAKRSKHIADELKNQTYDATAALNLAASARTGDQMERAKEAVKSALMTVDIGDTATIEALNKAYIDLRANIEKLTKAQKNEQTLQPSLRNEYARILAEIDKVAVAKERLEATEAYTRGDKQAKDDYKALEAREADLLKRKAEIRTGNEALLTEIETKHEAERAQKRTESLVKYEKELEDFRAKYGEITSFTAQDVIDSSSDAKNVRQSQKAIEDLKEARAKLSTQDANYEETLEKLNAEIKKHEEHIERVTKAEEYREKQAKMGRETYKGAMDYSKQAKSINDLKEAIRALDVARKKEDLSTRQGKKNYKELTRELEAQQERYDKLTQEIKSSNKGLVDTIGQLKRAFGLLFSVSQIRGYIHQIVEVRGEFEMQHRSMQVLIGDIDKANELWDKTISLATKSPFRVKELVTYTKQLAAYQVEADKLYETNKMLADISSGLGVDMNRLILAFGQVKAANYLRGTELRQFSEAGINILDLLAKRFEEVQGRAISTGEVFEMVSKRLVSFEDVNAVLQQVTSEGGMFYQMQEKQSETLQGMIRNLRDSIDLMMNDMGISMNDELKNAVTLVKTLVDEWRKLVPVVAAIGTTMLFNTARRGILALIGGVDKLIRGFKRLRAASSAAAAVNPWLLLATVIASVTAAVIAAHKEVNRLTAAMGQVESNNKKQLTESIALYRKLAESANDATKTELEREKAMKNLEERFKSILPDSMLEAEYVKQLGSNYEEANRAMMAYYDAKTREQKKDKVDAMFDADIYEKKFPKLVSGLKHITETTSVLTEEQKILVESYAGNIFGDIIDSAKKGEIAVESLFDVFKNRLSEYTEIPLETIDEMFRRGGSAWVEGRLESLGGVLEEYKNTLSGVTGLSYTTKSEAEAMEWKNAEKENLEAIMAEYKKFATYYHQFATANKKDREKIANSVTLSLSQVPSSLAAYKPHLENAVNALKKAAEGGAWSFASSMQTIEQDFVSGLNRIVKESADAQEGDRFSYKDKFIADFATNMQEGIDEAAKSLNLSNFQVGIIDGIETVVEKTKVSVDEFAKYLPKMGESLSDVKNRVSGDIETLKSRVEDYTTSISSGLYETSIISEKILNENPQQIEYFEKTLIPALRLFLHLLGDAEKPKTVRGGASLMSERIKVVDDMNKAYKDLNKTLSENEALEGAFAKYKDAFQKAYAGTTLLPKDFGTMTAEQFLKEFNFTTEEGMVGFFDKLIAYAKKTGEQVDVELAKGEYIMEARVELKKDEDKALVEEIQELFDQYDLSLELKELGLPSDLAKSLFGQDYLDLDGLKEAIEARESEFIGKDMVKEYEGFLKKISDLSRKQREDEAKEFVNFLKKNLNEIKVIQDKGAYNIALADRLLGEGKITVEQYLSSIRQIIGDTNKEVSRANLELFKDSPQYIQAMGDLTAYTTKEIRELIRSLEDVVAENSDAFSADEAKAYIDAIYNAQEKLDELERSPFRWETFANIGEILKTDEEVNAQKEERNRLQEQEKSQLEELVRLEEKLKRLQEEKNAILSGEGDLESKANRLAPVQSDIDATTQAIKQGEQAVAATQSQAKTTETILGKLGDKLKGLTGKGGGAASTIAIIDAIINGINDTVQGVLEITNEIGSVMESFGKETDMSTGFGKFQKGFSIFAESSQHAADGWNALKSGDPVGAVVSVVKSVTSLIRGINEYKDAELQVEIEKQAKEVERLGKAYEKLEEATEKAYSIQHLQKYNEQLKRNVELQIASYKSMIAAEEAKKNTDEDQIAAWNEELEALTKQWEELKESLLEGVGGISQANYRSQTREFVDSWVSAFKETGDGLKGLKDNFREFFDNIIAEQATLRVTEKFLEPFYESLNSALGDYELTAKESKDLREMVEKIAPDLSEALEKIWGQLGGSNGETSGGSLSALQKGIQGITEDTAQIIEAYLNSVRGYVSEQVTHTRNIYKILNEAATSQYHALWVKLAPQ